ncbi:hypothetical protein OSI78_11040, partial [Mycobacterium ulcerans]
GNGGVGGNAFAAGFSGTGGAAGVGAGAPGGVGGGGAADLHNQISRTMELPVKMASKAATADTAATSD